MTDSSETLGQQQPRRAASGRAAPCQRILSRAMNAPSTMQNPCSHSRELGSSFPVWRRVGTSQVCGVVCVSIALPCVAEVAPTSTDHASTLAVVVTFSHCLAHSALFVTTWTFSPIQLHRTTSSSLTPPCSTPLTHVPPARCRRAGTVGNVQEGDDGGEGYDHRSSAVMSPDFDDGDFNAGSTPTKNQLGTVNGVYVPPHHILLLP